MASHAALASAQASNTASKSDDPTFALMLDAAAPAAAKTKNDGDKQPGDQQPSQDKDDTAANVAQPVTAVQVQAVATQTPTKASKDFKADDSGQAAVQAAPDAPVDPSAVMTVAVAPQQAAASANDNDGDETVDAVTAAPAASSPVAPQPTADDATDNDDNAAPAGTSKRTQQAAVQNQQAAPQPAASQQAQQQPAPAAAMDVQPAALAKPGAKAAKSTDTTATDKAAPRKAAATDASDGVKTARADDKPDSKTDSRNDTTQAPQAEAKTTPAQPQLPNLGLTGVSTPQPQTQTGAPQAAVPANTLAQHIQVTAQPNVPALAVEIAAKSQSGAKQFDIRLDPPELGRVEVRLSIDSSGKASAHLSADQPQTLDLLQKDAPALTRALRDAGLNVSQDGLNFSLRQQAQDNGRDSGFAGGNARGRATLSAIVVSDSSNATSAYRAPLDGRLDIRV